MPFLLISSVALTMCPTGVCFPPSSPSAPTGSHKASRVEGNIQGKAPWNQSKVEEAHVVSCNTSSRQEGGNPVQRGMLKEPGPGRRVLGK